MNKTYVRIQFKPYGQPAVTFWAEKLGPRVYNRIDKEGGWGRDGVKRLFVGEPVWEKPAVMNLHYGWLELALP